MIIQTREFGYGEGFQSLVEGLHNWKEAVESKYKEAKITVMYNLAGERGRMTIQTAYPSMADYERIDAALDADEEIGAIMASFFEHVVTPIKDQFYRVVS